MTLTAWERAARAFEPPLHRFPTPGDLAQEIDPRNRQTQALNLIDQALVRVAETPDSRLIISMPPQEGKSLRAGIMFPIWTLIRNPDTRIVVASYGQALAIRNGRAIRSRITGNPDLGLRIASDNGAVHDWTVDGHQGGVLSVGIGSGLTGRPADMLVIDDPIKDRKEANSETYREAVWDWWTDVASTRLAPGAPVVVMLTRWHQDDLAGKLLADDEHDSWQVLNIPAQADHDPTRGEVDVLDRKPGEFMDSARGRTREQWELRKRTSGSRTWASLFQGRPSPAEGDIWQRDWWSTYTTPLAIRRPNGAMFVPRADGGGIVIQSWDMAFKDTKSSDYVVGQVWFTDGVHAYLLDQVRERMSFVNTVKAVVQMTAKWPQAALKLVEDKANGTAVINALRKRVPGLIPEEPMGSKEARAQAVAPFIEAANVHLPAPELAPWVGEFIEEAAAFPNGAHDDQVDAASQALTRLLLTPMLTGQTIVTADDLDDDIDNYRITDY